MAFEYVCFPLSAFQRHDAFVLIHQSSGWKAICTALDRVIFLAAGECMGL